MLALAGCVAMALPGAADTNYPVSFSKSFKAASPNSSCIAVLNRNEPKDLSERVERFDISRLTPADVIIYFEINYCRQSPDGSPKEAWDSGLTLLTDNFEQNAIEKGRALWGNNGRFEAANSFDKELIMRGGADQYAFELISSQQNQTSRQMDDLVSDATAKYVILTVLDRNFLRISSLSDAELRLHLSTSSQTASSFTLLLKHILDLDTVRRLDRIVNELNAEGAIKPAAYFFLADWFAIRQYGHQLAGTYFGCAGKKAIIDPAVDDPVQAAQLLNQYNFSEAQKKLLADYERQVCDRG